VEFLNGLGKVYEVLNAGKAYPSLKDLLIETGLDKFAQVSMNEYLQGKNINEQYIKEYIDGYNQLFYNERNLNALTGFVDYIGVNYGIYQVKEGNDAMIKGMIGWLNSQNNFKISMNDTVFSIKKDKRKYIVDATSGKYEYDIVIIASNMNDNKIQLPKNKMRGHKLNIHKGNTCTVTLMAGLLNNTVFGVSAASDIPDLVIPMDRKETIVSGIANRHDGIVKFYSTQPLTQTILQTYFTGPVDIINSYTWPFSYPQFPPVRNLDTLPRFELARDLYYINAMEEVMSLMEGELMASKNVVNLLLKKLKT